MKFFIGLSLIFFLLVQHSSGQADMMERKKLFELLEQRKQKFNDYSASLEKRTGFFGNKTKKDMQLSNEVLTDIVRTDNNIIGVLNRAIDFKSYEKTSMNYNVIENSTQLDNLLHATDTLSKQVNALSGSNKKLGNEVHWLRIVNRIMLFSLIILLLLMIRKKRKTQQ